MAADLSMGGHEVHIYEHPKFTGVEETLKPIRDKGGITLTARDDFGVEFAPPGGGKVGFTKVSMATTDMKEAIKGVELIMVIVPAFAQKILMEAFVPYLEDGQVVVFSPGNFATLDYFNSMKEKCDKKVTIAEAECMIYACRRTGPASVRIKNYKEKVKIAAMPAAETNRALKVISNAYKVYYPGTNVFDTSLNNVNTVLHPASALLNVVKIEELGAHKGTHYSATPSVGKVMVAVDKEKMAVAKALGLYPEPTKEILERYYGAHGKDFYETMCNCKPYQKQITPDSMMHRYVHEDIPFGQVPIASIGEQVKVPTPTMKGLITIASVFNEIDYWRMGRSAENLGLGGMNAQQMTNYVTLGSK